MEESKDSEDEEIAKITDKVDLFKAIFLSSSDEEDETEENSSTQDSQQIKELDYRAREAMENKKEIRYSPARGIFANLDLESLKSKPSYSKNDEQDVPASTSTSTASFEVMETKPKASTVDNLLYGPKMPTALSTSNVKKEPKCEYDKKKEKDDSLVWVEKSKKHKKHKKHKKQKHKKNK